MRFSEGSGFTAVSETKTNNIESGPEIRGVKDRFNEIPRIIEYSGFTEGQEKWVKKAINRLGFPTDNINQVTYRENSPREGQTLGSLDLLTGEMRLYKLLETQPEIAQFATIVHESAHSADPFAHVEPELRMQLPDFESVYESEEDRKHAASHAVAIAYQTESTHVYLSGYHKKLHKALMEGKIDQRRFDMETHAIMIEQRMTNPNHLRQVEQSQRAKLTKLGRQTEFIAITTDDSEQVPKGVDKTLISLIKSVNNVNELDTHILNLRTSFSNFISPLG